ncbi:hypothetical protein BELL_0052g00330 [Botrytis elliptica]|uniref:Zn(2)-C6 fungal-type domain-containing protein n=1 Tax=Botrytis elliptica TaxID=278938 RepID=A0A4Z1JZB5_9HELO|nr:hypothetical protein EAE99_008377 [Botrytis elliptica]TGO78858.1 hypothetical protein BELL_0052g00330 [Botrytis elliptica]
MKRSSPSTGTSFPSYQCQICLSTYSTIGHLRRHEAVHAGQRLYGCHFCDQHFFRSDAARRHSKSCPIRGGRPMPQPRPRGKQKQSCDSCARSKRACNQGRPCEGCQLNNIPCTYYRSTGSKDGSQPLQAIQDLGSSRQPLHDTAPTHFDQASNNATASGIPSQDPRMQFDFLLHYTKPGRESLLDFFGTPTASSVSTPTVSTAMSSSLMSNSSLLAFPGELEDLMQSNALPILDDFIWNGELSTLPINSTLRSSSQLEGRLQELISKLSVTHQRLSELDGDLPPFSEEIKTVLFTVPNLIDFTRLFFDHWYPNCPIIHQPTYNIETVSLPLLFAVFLIGAAYSAPRDTAGLAKECGALCEEFVFENEELKEILRSEQYTEKPTSLQIIQAAFLVSVLRNWQNGQLARKRMRNRRYCDVVNGARALGYNSTRNMYATGVFPFNWHGYIEAEARVRVMSLIYLVDCHYTLFNKYPPRLTIAEMVGDMPSSDEAFAATDALVCEGYLLGTNEEPRATLATSLEWLMGDEWNPVHHYGLTTLNLFTFLNALNTTIFHLKVTSLWIYNSARISQALDRWKILWDNHLKQVGPDFTRSGFFKNSLEFWQLTKLLLKIEGNMGQKGLCGKAEMASDSMAEINALMDKFQGVAIS